MNPKRPLYDDGMRIEPPPSLPVQIGIMPVATAAAEPPDEPPGVRSGFHGLRVVPCRNVRVQFVTGKVLQPRYWLVSESGNELVQIQTDRFIFNWRKQLDQMGKVTK